MMMDLWRWIGGSLARPTRLGLACRAFAAGVLLAGGAVSAQQGDASPGGTEEAQPARENATQGGRGPNDDRGAAARRDPVADLLRSIDPAKLNLSGADLILTFHVHGPRAVKMP